MAKSYSIFQECRGIWSIVHHLCLKYFKGYNIWINKPSKKTPLYSTWRPCTLSTKSSAKVFSGTAHLHKSDYKFKKKHRIISWAWSHLMRWPESRCFKVQSQDSCDKSSSYPTSKAKVQTIAASGKATTTAWRQGHEWKVATHSLSMLL